MQNTKWIIVSLTILITALSSGVSPARAEEPRDRRLVQNVVDSATGSRIRVYQTGPLAFTVEIAKDDVEVTKEVGSRKSVTTIRAGVDRLVLVTEPSGVSVTTGGATARFTRDSQHEIDRLRDLFRESNAVRRAAGVVRGLVLPAKSPLNALLFTTRATLLAAVDDRPALAELTNTMSRAVREARVVRVVDEGPGECWNEYAREAIAAYMELEDCLKYASLLDRVLRTCEIIYDMRAIGAFAWWVKCVGLSNT